MNHLPLVSGLVLITPTNWSSAARKYEHTDELKSKASAVNVRKENNLDPGQSVTQQKTVTGASAPPPEPEQSQQSIFQHQEFSLAADLSDFNFSETKIPTVTFGALLR